MQGFLVVLVLGLVLLAGAAAADRRSSRRALEAVGIPPCRSTAALRPVPDEARRRVLEDFRREHPRLGLRLADASMNTWRAPDCLELDDLLVLCCPEGVGSQRELLDARAAARVRGACLVVAATTFPEEELALVTAAPGVAAPVLLGSPEDCLRLARLAGAIPAGRADLQAGLAGQALGRLERIVADSVGCWVQAPEPSTLNPQG